MFELYQLVVAALVVLVGSTVVAAVGFGIGLTTAPVLLLVLDPQTVVLLINTVSIALFVLIILQTRNYLPAREMIPIAAAGLLGVPFGVLALSLGDPSVLRIAISAVILVVTVAMVVNTRKSVKLPRVAGPLTGFAVAAMVTALAIGGPLLVLYLLGRGWTRHTVRASLSLFFLLTQSISVLGYGVAGMFTMERVTLILIVTGPVLIGFTVASMIVRRMNERRFRQGVIAVIVVTSLMVLGREFLTL